MHCTYTKGPRFLLSTKKGSLAWKLALGAAAHRQTIGSTLLEIEVLGVVATLLSRVPDAMHACARRWAGLVVAGWSHSDNAVQAMALEVCRTWAAHGNPAALIELLNPLGKQLTTNRESNGGGAVAAAAAAAAGNDDPLNGPPAVVAAARLALLAAVAGAEHDSSVVLTSGAAAAAAEAGQRFSGHSHHRHHPANAFPANASEIVIASDSRSGTKHLFKQLKTWFALPGAEHAASALRAWIGLTRLLLG